MATGISTDLMFVGDGYATFAAGTYVQYDFLIHVDETYDLGSNTSDITLSLFCRCNGYDYGTGNFDFKIKVNGVVVDALTATESSGNCRMHPGRDWTELLYRGSTVRPTITGIAHGSTGEANITIEIVPNNYSNITFYLGSASFGYPGFKKGKSFSVPLSVIPRGLVNIYNGSYWQKHQCYIYNGTNWALHMPYIWNGSSWALYGG